MFLGLLVIGIQESHHEKFYQGIGPTEREQPEARRGKQHAQMKTERVWRRDHTEGGKTFRNRWTARMVRRLGIWVREGLGR